MDTCATVQCLMEMKNQKKCPGNRNKEDKFIHKKLEYNIILIEYNCQNGETTASFIYSNAFNNLSFTGEWPCLAMQIMICHLSEAKAEVAWRCCSAAKLLKEGSEAKWFRRVQIRHQRLQFAKPPIPTVNFGFFKPCRQFFPAIKTKPIWLIERNFENIVTKDIILLKRCVIRKCSYKLSMRAVKTYLAACQVSGLPAIRPQSMLSFLL